MDRTARARFAVSGVDAMVYDKPAPKRSWQRSDAFQQRGYGQLRHVPQGKLIDGNLSGYEYGPLTYQFARAAIVDNNVAVDASDGDVPLIARRDVGTGEVAYIALPLGYLRDFSDAFPMTLLTALLTSRSSLPHLVAAPDGPEH